MLSESGGVCRAVVFRVLSLSLSTHSLKTAVLFFPRPFFFFIVFFFFHRAELSGATRMEPAGEVDFQRVQRGTYYMILCCCVYRGWILDIW